MNKEDKVASRPVDLPRGFGNCPEAVVPKEGMSTEAHLTPTGVLTPLRPRCRSQPHPGEARTLYPERESNGRPKASLTSEEVAAGGPAVRHLYYQRQAGTCPDPGFPAAHLCLSTVPGKVSTPVIFVHIKNHETNQPKGVCFSFIDTYTWVFE